MRKFILAILAVGTVAGVGSSAASAGDGDWAGGFVGGNVGLGSTHWAIPFYDGQFPAGGEKKVHDSGVVGGLQAGYNWEMNSIVLGVIGDFQASSMKSDQKGGFDFDSCGCFNVSMDSFGTLRGRAGFAFDPGIMIYGTGGLIVGNLDYSAADSSPIGSDNITAAGWTAGIGGEMMVTDSLSVSLEWLHYDFGKSKFNLGDPNFNTKIKVNGDVARIGVNLHF